MPCDVSLFHSILCVPFQIREAAQALLQAELRRIGPDGRQSLVERWAVWVSPASFKAGVGMNEKLKDSKRYVDDSDLMLESTRPIPTLHEQATALVILGMIGAEFASSWDRVATSRRRSDSSKGGKVSPFPRITSALDSIIDSEVLYSMTAVQIIALLVCREEGWSRAARPKRYGHGPCHCETDSKDPSNCPAGETKCKTKSPLQHPLFRS